LPRKPDTGLESAILRSALQLLDNTGIDLLTMRDVARGANTSTTTLYERFADRQALLWGLVAKVQADIHQRVLPARSVEELIAAVEQYLEEYPNRLDLCNRYWSEIMTSGRPRPVFELAKGLLISTRGFDPESAEQVALSLAALLIGTAVLRRKAGDGNLADALLSSSLRAAKSI